MSSTDTDAKVLEILTEQLTAAHSTYKQSLREVQMLDLNTQCMNLSTQLVSNPSSVHKSIRNEISAAAGAISTIRVGEKTFTDKNICDGFFESLSGLKAPDMSGTTSTPEFIDTLRDYKHVMELAKSGAAIPAIELYQSV